MKSILIALPIAAVLTVGGNAALIAGLTLESGTTNPFNTIPMGPLKAINGEGLPSDTPALVGTHGTSFDEQWWSFGGTNSIADIVINLNGVYSIDAVQVWNYNEGGVTSRGIQNAEIFVSPDGDIANLVKLTTNGTGAQDNGSGNFVLPRAPGNNTYSGFSLDLSGVTNATLLDNVALFQVRALDGYSAANAGNGNRPQDGTGLAEIQFDGTPIPEPGSLMLTAIAGITLLRRRR